MQPAHLGFGWRWGSRADLPCCLPLGCLSHTRGWVSAEGALQTCLSGVSAAPVLPQPGALPSPPASGPPSFSSVQILAPPGPQTE